MPFTLHPISRREFLARSLVALAGTIVVPRIFGSEPAADPHRFAFLADTHINARPGTVDHGINMTDHLHQVAAELAGLDSRPFGAFVVGDLAHQTGEPGDYAAFLGLLDPVHAAGTPVHLTLGNHDHRERFCEALPPSQQPERPVANRTAAIVKSARANFFILDSLDQTNKVPGVCGDAQLQWLADALDANPGKPAITMVHHQPDEHAGGSGLTDTKALLEVLRPRRQVKAHLFGHTHDWRVTVTDGLHLINLPPVAYVFAAGRPNGWVDMQLDPEGARLELHTIDPAHPANHKPAKLKWR